MFKKLISFLFLFVCLNANAVVYNFLQTDPNNNTLLATSLGQQLSLEVTDAGGGFIDFAFTNNVGISSSIVDIYLGYYDVVANNPFSSFTRFSQSTGVEMPDNGATPINLPDGGNFDFNTVYSIDSRGPTPPLRVTNGLDNNGETLVIRGQTTSSFADVVGLIDNGQFGAGLNVRDLGTTNGTVQFLTASAVPEPETYAMFAIGLLFVCFMKRKTT